MNDDDLAKFDALHYQHQKTVYDTLGHDKFVSAYGEARIPKLVFRFHSRTPEEKAASEEQAKAWLENMRAEEASYRQRYPEGFDEAERQVSVANQ